MTAEFCQKVTFYEGESDTLRQLVQDERGKPPDFPQCGIKHLGTGFAYVEASSPHSLKGKTMRYEHFKTDMAAASRVTQLRAEGYTAFWQQLSTHNYEVRFWRTYGMAHLHG